jgi:hypothetical protein
MDKALYDTKAEALGRAIDLGIESVQKYPPKGFNQRHLDQVVHVYMDYKRAALCPEPKFRNKQSLRQIEHDILTYFQEEKISLRKSLNAAKSKIKWSTILLWMYWCHINRRG